MEKLNVPGSIEDRHAEGYGYVPQTCLACRLVHLVSPVTGELMSETPRRDDDS